MIFATRGRARPGVTLPGTFRDTLTIDNPHDIDWIRFRVTGLAAAVTIKIGPSLGGSSRLERCRPVLLTVPGGGASSTLDILNRRTPRARRRR